MKGVKLALQWQAKVLYLKTDSLCTYHWLKNSLSGKAKVWTKAMTEMFVRRLQTLLWLIDEYGLTIGMTLVRLEYNRGNGQTREPQKLFNAMKQGKEMALDVCSATLIECHILDIHRHSEPPGVRWTAYFA